MAAIAALKIMTAALVVVGVVVGIIDVKYRPDHILLQTSPERPWWLPPWLGFALTSAAAMPQSFTSCSTTCPK
jgi:hypothetical protein